MSTTAKTKLVQYLTEAHAKEKQLEVSLEAHIGMASRDTYKKRLKEHLKETRGHARLVERRLKALDGSGFSKTVADKLNQGIAAAKGPLHGLRGTSAEEKELKNAKTEYSEEHEEIATYRAIETLADELNDKETAKIARQICREEERMAKFLEKQIPILTKAVIKAEIPAKERSLNGAGPAGTRKRSSTKRSSTKRSGGKRSSSSSKKRTTSGSSKRATSRSSSRSSARSSASRSRSSGSRSRARS